MVLSRKLRKFVPCVWISKGNLDANNYRTGIAEHIKQAIVEQERLGLDVLVHGEAERNDMVEYFGEHLDGFVFTQNGWVQSYGSRCVKPPIVIGDVSRPAPITVEWAKYAQSLTDKPVKGMLTGPVTILCWSFPREDVSRETIAKQIALALRDEVADLEAAGIGIIQIDEPALREGLPLRRSDWDAYLQWGVEAFRINAAVAKDDTQIHTHMCYCEFNDIMDSIAALDADVITIETSRSDMELLESFEEFDYPNEIGPGVYDIHSPNVPSVEWIEALLKKAAKRIPAERLWVNPDCGLKTRGWPETRAALANMVQAAQNLRRGKSNRVVIPPGLFSLQRLLPTIPLKPLQHTLPAVFRRFGMIARAIISVECMSGIRVHDNLCFRISSPQRLAHRFNALLRNAVILTTI